MRDPRLWRMQYVAGQLAGAYSRLVPLAGWRTPERRPQVVTAKTAVCIEGFPRSGNWFALRVFQEANPEVGPIAHHIHLAGQIRRAGRYGVPCVALVRDPVGAVASFLLFEDRLTPRIALWSWIRYHETVARSAHAIEILPFDQLLEMPESVVARLNRRYGREFAIPQLDPDGTAAVLDRLEHDQRYRQTERTRSTPTPQRRQANEHARQRVMAEPAIDSAVALYERLGATAVPAPG